MEPVTQITISERTRQPTQRSLRGFTLVELLAVIGVILLLLAVLLPAIRGSVDGHLLTDAGQRFSALIEQARVHATTTKHTVLLRFFPHPDHGNIERGVVCVGLLEIDPSAAPGTPPRLIDRILHFQSPILISWEHSSALQNGGMTASRGTLPGSGEQPCIDLYLFSDGSSSLIGASPNPYFTLVSSRDETDLRNPFVVSMDPLTTRVTLFRR